MYVIKTFKLFFIQYKTQTYKINKNIYGKTFYTRFGNVFSLILLILMIILLIKSMIQNEKK